MTSESTDRIVSMDRDVGMACWRDEELDPPLDDADDDDPVFMLHPLLLSLLCDDSDVRLGTRLHPLLVMLFTQLRIPETIIRWSLVYRLVNWWLILIIRMTTFFKQLYDRILWLLVENGSKQYFK